MDNQANRSRNKNKSSNYDKESRNLEDYLIYGNGIKLNEMREQIKKENFELFKESCYIKELNKDNETIIIKKKQFAFPKKHRKKENTKWEIERSTNISTQTKTYSTLDELIKNEGIELDFRKEPHSFSVMRIYYDEKKGEWIEESKSLDPRFQNFSETYLSFSSPCVSLFTKKQSKNDNKKGKEEDKEKAEEDVFIHFTKSIAFLLKRGLIKRRNIMHLKGQRFSRFLPTKLSIAFLLHKEINQVLTSHFLNSRLLYGVATSPLSVAPSSPPNTNSSNNPTHWTEYLSLDDPVVYDNATKFQNQTCKSPPDNALISNSLSESLYSSSSLKDASPNEIISSPHSEDDEKKKEEKEKEEKVRLYVRINNEEEGLGDYKFAEFLLSPLKKNLLHSYFEKNEEKGTLKLLSPFLKMINVKLWKILVKVESPSNNNPLPSYISLEDFNKIKEKEKKRKGENENITEETNREEKEREVNIKGEEMVYVMEKIREEGEKEMEIRGSSHQNPLLYVEGTDLEKAKQYFPYSYYYDYKTEAMLESLPVVRCLLEKSASFLHPLALIRYNRLLDIYTHQIFIDGKDPYDYLPSLFNINKSPSTKNSNVSSKNDDVEKTKGERGIVLEDNIPEGYDLFEKAKMAQNSAKTRHLSLKYLQQIMNSKEMKIDNLVKEFFYLETDDSREKTKNLEKLSKDFPPLRDRYSTLLSQNRTKEKTLQSNNSSFLGNYPYLDFDEYEYEELSRNEKISFLVHSFFLGNMLSADKLITRFGFKTTDFEKYIYGGKIDFDFEFVENPFLSSSISHRIEIKKL